MEMRLQKFLANAGIASRRAAEKLIEEGKVTVNGNIIREQGIKVDEDKDIIKYMGEIVKINKEYKYYMLNKPIRYVTTASDEKGRKTVLDLLNVKERVFPVGRLDFLSSGLLLLTNDGDLTYRLTHPKHNVDKKYVAIVEPKVSSEKIKELEKGVDLELFRTSECEIKLLKETRFSQTYEVVIHEGKNRQIRRMFEFVGSEVKKLKRVAIGKLDLDRLGTGEYRELTGEEVEYLKGL